MPVAYIVCAAGAGSRTREINPEIPKPLLRLNGKYLLSHAVASLPLEKDDLVVIVGQKDHRLQRAEPEIQNIVGFTPIQWLELEQLTRGQLETAYLAALTVPESYSLAIFNADSAFDKNSLPPLNRMPFEALIPCSIESGDNWSFFKAGAFKKNFATVTAAAEKIRISEWCSIGFYFFKSHRMFTEFASLEMQATTQEVYVAPVFNRYITAGLPVAICKITGFRAMGTLQQIADYWRVSLEEMKKQNH